MKLRRSGILFIWTLASVVLGLSLYQVLGLSFWATSIVSATLILVVGGTLFSVCSKDGELQRPKVLTAIFAVVLMICVGVVALVWYALANSTDL